MHLNSVFIILIAVLLGILAGLGVGGGSILLLWLTLVIKLPIEEAKVINLMFFIPCASIAAYHEIRSSHVEIKTILPAIIGGCISAFLFSQLSSLLPIQWLKKLFGFILLITGVHEIRYRPRNAR